MKIRLIDRIMLGVSGLVCAGASAFAIYDCLQGFKLAAKLRDIMANGGVLAAVIASACMVLVLAIGITALVLAFKIRKEPGFVKQQADHGELNIAVTAIDELVRKCVATHDEIKLTDTSISNGKEGLTIGLRLSLASGVSIPLAVAALQKQMKQYITASTGLDVKDVCVQVDTAEAKDLNATSFVMPDMLGSTPVEEHTDVPSHLNCEASVREDEEPLMSQRMFGAGEALAFVPAPPVETEVTETAEEAAQTETAEAMAEAAEAGEQMETEETVKSEAEELELDALRMQMPVEEVQL